MWATQLLVHGQAAAQPGGMIPGGTMPMPGGMMPPGAMMSGGMMPPGANGVRQDDATPGDNDWHSTIRYPARRQNPGGMLPGAMPDTQPGDTPPGGMRSIHGLETLWVAFQEQWLLPIL
jgi:hypothetical protein